MHKVIKCLYIVVWGELFHGSRFTDGQFKLSTTPFFPFKNVLFEILEGYIVGYPVVICFPPCFLALLHNAYLCLWHFPLLITLAVLRCSVQFSSVGQSCLTLCDPMNCSTPGLPVHHQLPEFSQTHVHRVDDAIQPYHPLSSPFPLAPNPSQHQSLFQ